MVDSLYDFKKPFLLSYCMLQNLVHLNDSSHIRDIEDSTLFPQAGLMPGQSKFIKLNSCHSLCKFSLVCVHFMKCLAQKLFFLLASLRKQFQNITYTLDLEDYYLNYDFLKIDGLFTYVKKHGHLSNQTSISIARHVRYT